MNQGSTTVPTVVQICQPGFDIRTCPDWAFLFNSSWPNLAIAFEITVTTPAPSVIPHNLGFPPLVVGWGNNTGANYGRFSSVVFSVDSTNIYVSASLGDSMTIRAFNIDVSKEQSYPLPQSAQAKLPYNDQFGIKVLKQTSQRVITSNNLNDFVIHSRAQSPAVLTVATQAGRYFTNSNPGSQTAGPWLVVPLQTSYMPWAIGVVSPFSGRYQFYSVNGLELINNQVVFPMQGITTGSLIILRDPLFYPNTVRVVY